MNLKFAKMSTSLGAHPKSSHGRGPGVHFARCLPLNPALNLMSYRNMFTVARNRIYGDLSMQLAEHVFLLRHAFRGGRKQWGVNKSLSVSESTAPYIYNVDTLVRSWLFFWWVELLVSGKWKFSWILYQWRSSRGGSGGHVSQTKINIAIKAKFSPLPLVRQN